MAIATAFVPTAMPKMDVWYGDVRVNNSSAIVISEFPGGGSRKTEYFGSFSSSNDGGISGTLDSINEYQFGTLIYSVKNIGADASQAYQAIQILGDFDLAASIILGKDDTFYGSSGSDFLRSYNGNDVIHGNGGADRLDGGAGIDTAVVSDMRDAASVSIENGYIYLSHSSGSVELYNMERVEFLDGAIAFDTEGFTSAGAAYRLYKAAFDRVPDDDGLGYWITRFDQGASAREVANAFVISGEFNSLYGENLNNEGFVTALYGNVLDRTPDAGGLSYWLDVMANNPEANRAGVLASFSESAENISNTAVLTGTGMWYQVYDDVVI